MSEHMTYHEALNEFEKQARTCRGRFGLVLVRDGDGFVVRSPWIGDRERALKRIPGNTWTFQRNRGMELVPDFTASVKQGKQRRS